MIALLTGAVMFALGLFFGWLLHRERVERALYEDAVRARDRANTTLAETSARLELANRDLVRLREQLTDAQHRLERQDETIARLERDHADVGVDSDGEVDITEEVALPAADGTRVTDEGDAASGVPSTPIVEDAAEVEYDADPADAPAPVVDDVGDDADPGEPSAPIVADDAPAAHEPEEDTETGTGGTDRPAAEVPVTDAATPVTPAPDDVPGEPAVSDEDSIAAPAPQRGSPDDLRLISGVGPALERLLYEHGITTFRNLALLDDAAIEDLRSRSPRLVTRLRRDAWVSQARRLHIETHGDEP